MMEYGVMPKTQINWPLNPDPNAQDSDNVPESTGERHYEKTLHVGWGGHGDRSGTIQISLRAPLEEWERFSREHRASKDRQSPPWEDGWMPEAYSGTLTRSEVNSLILVLRKARDSVYGKDE